mgnify:CR=1 FL=1
MSLWARLTCSVVSVEVSDWKTALNAIDFFPGSTDTFGLGFLINGGPVDGGRAAGSLAWAGLYNTYFWIDRARGWLLYSKR